MTNLTKSEMFKLAHARAKEDSIWQKTSMYPENKPYAYYFRLQLINLYAVNNPALLTAEMLKDGRIAA